MHGHMAFVARPGRIEISIPVVLDVDGERISAETRNVGLGGAFVAMRAPLFVGQRVPLQISLPDLNEPLRVEGEVRWLRAPGDDRHHPNGTPGAGVRFVKQALYVAATLDHFVRSRERGR